MWAVGDDDTQGKTSAMFQALLKGSFWMNPPKKTVNHQESFVFCFLFFPALANGPIWNGEKGDVCIGNGTCWIVKLEVFWMPRQSWSRSQRLWIGCAASKKLKWRTVTFSFLIRSFFNNFFWRFVFLNLNSLVSKFWWFYSPGLFLLFVKKQASQWEWQVVSGFKGTAGMATGGWRWRGGGWRGWWWGRRRRNWAALGWCFLVYLPMDDVIRQTQFPRPPSSGFFSPPISSRLRRRLRRMCPFHGESDRIHQKAHFGPQICALRSIRMKFQIFLLPRDWWQVSSLLQLLGCFFTHNV